MPIHTHTPRLRFDGVPIEGADLVPPRTRVDQPSIPIAPTRRLSINALVRNLSIPPEVEPQARTVRKRCSPVLVVSSTEQRYLARKLSSVTPRELEVLLALCGGGTNDKIASQLSITPATLRTHIVRLSQKLDVAGKSELVRTVVGVLLDGYRTGALPRSTR